MPHHSQSSGVTFQGCSRKKEQSPSVNRTLHNSLDPTDNIRTRKWNTCEAFVYQVCYIGVQQALGLIQTSFFAMLLCTDPQFPGLCPSCGVFLSHHLPQKSLLFTAKSEQTAIEVSVDCFLFRFNSKEGFFSMGKQWDKTKDQKTKHKRKNIPLLGPGFGKSP